MKLSVNKIVDNLIWILTVFILVTYLVFEMYAWGRYAYLGASLAIMLLSAWRHKSRIKIRMVPYYGFMLLFIGFTALSSLWAMNMSDSVNKAVTLVLILICNVMVYTHYQYEDDVQKLLRAVMWAGYVVAIYAIMFYGLDTIMLATEGSQVGNEFSNINTIGMTIAIACVIQVHEWLYKNKRWSVVFLIPSFVVIAALQSRTAFVSMLFGVFLVCFFRHRNSSNLMNRFGKSLVFLVAVLISLLVMYYLPVFSGVRSRMDRLIAGFLGQAGADRSTMLRREMVDLGWEWFLKYPIGGVGIGNPHILSGRYLMKDSYLHNNYAELLCGGGIIGFGIYYSMHIYLLCSLVKNRDADRKAYEFGISLLLMLMLMDFGTVSYYPKQNWFYLMILFLNVAALRRKHKRS